MRRNQVSRRKIVLKIEGGSIIEALGVPADYEIAIVDLDQKSIGEIWKYKLPDSYYVKRRKVRKKRNKKRKV